MDQQTNNFFSNYYFPINEFTILDSVSLYNYIYSELTGTEYNEEYDGELILKDTEDFSFQKLNENPNDERILMIRKNKEEINPEMENVSEVNDREDQEEIFFNDGNFMNKEEETENIDENKINNLENNTINIKENNQISRIENKTENLASTIDKTKLRTIKKEKWNDLLTDPDEETSLINNKMLKKNEKCLINKNG